MNGNDAITLEKGADAATAVKVDIFGKIGEDPGTAWTDQSPFTGTNGTWITSNHTLIRKSSIKGGVTTNPALFDVMSQYDSLPVNTWTNLGSHSCECFVGIKEISNDAQISMYPNPATNGEVFLTSNQTIDQVLIYNLAGQLVYTHATANKGYRNTFISTSALNKGIYFVKIKHTNGSLSLEKLIVQ